MKTPTPYAEEGEKAVLFESDPRCHHCTLPIDMLENAGLMDTFGPRGGRFLYHAFCLAPALLNQTITRASGIRVHVQERGE